MKIAADALIGLVALIHLYILVLEMFLWTTPRTRAGFGTTREFAEETKTLAANQGLYNGFLALALIWGLIAGEFQLQLYGLVCVIVAGIYGALTATKRILFVQVLPGALALIALLLAR
jgi:putative membrane protein